MGGLPPASEPRSPSTQDPPGLKVPRKLLTETIDLQKTMRETRSGSQGCRFARADLYVHFDAENRSWPGSVRAACGPEEYVGALRPRGRRMATIEAATVMRKDKELGSIAAGKFADMILVSGDPTNNISDIRRVDVVIKNGNVYRPAEMYPAFGIRAE